MERRWCHCPRRSPHSIFSGRNSRPQTETGSIKRRIKTQTVLPSADTAAMLFWALLASGQINMRKVDGWQSLATTPIDQPTSQLDPIPSVARRLRRAEIPTTSRPAPEPWICVVEVEVSALYFVT
jgi:hypothetical protein